MNLKSDQLTNYPKKLGKTQKLNSWQNWKTQIKKKKKSWIMTILNLWLNLLYKGLLIRSFWHLDNRWDVLWAFFFAILARYFFLVHLVFLMILGPQYIYALNDFLKFKILWPDMFWNIGNPHENMFLIKLPPSSSAVVSSILFPCFAPPSLARPGQSSWPHSFTTVQGQLIKSGLEGCSSLQSKKVW